jgi:TrmH family RNA methyltransferase
MRLVDPRDGWPNEKALTSSSGANWIIEKASVHESLEDCLKDVTYVYATTARPRGMIKEVITPEQAGHDMRARVARGERVAMLFGRERTGLTNDEISLADVIVTAPVNPAFASINIAQAVLLMSYEWYKDQAESLGQKTPELPALEGMDVKKPILEVTDAMVNEEIEKICINEGSLESRDTAEHGDYLTGHAIMKGKDGTEQLFAFPYKADVKSLVWYVPENFADAGYAVPETMEDLRALTERIVADGGTPWCIGLGSGGATGWPATDWVEDMMLRTQSPDVYDKWVRHEIPFNDPAVIGAIEEFGYFARNDAYVAGGAAALPG